jgi:hypothetical protein
MCVENESYMRRTDVLGRHIKGKFSVKGATRNSETEKKFGLTSYRKAT